MRRTQYAIRKMAGKIIIDTERCKGCGLCVVVCLKNSIVTSKKSNKNGYFPAQARPVRSKTPAPLKGQGKKSLTPLTEATSNGATNTDCTGCCVCAIICPEAIIEVYRDQPDKVNIVAKPGKKGKPRLVEEKT